MAVKSGSDFFLKLNTQVVNASTTQSIELPVDIMDATTKDSVSKAKEKIAGELDGKIGIEGKWDEATSDYTIQEIIAARSAGTVLPFIWGGIEHGYLIITGNCLIQNFSGTAPQNGIATWSASLEITGPISLSTVA